MPQHVPHDMRQGPLVDWVNIDAAVQQLLCLLAPVEQQLPFQNRGRSWRMILDKNECRAAEVCVLEMK